MFKSVDILIGFSVVMLVVSFSVTLCTQTIAGFFNMRGLQLRNGVARLLQYVDHGIDRYSARIIADLVLTDPIVARPALMGGYRFATVLQREELTVLLLRIAAGQASELGLSVAEVAQRRAAAEAGVRGPVAKLRKWAFGIEAHSDAAKTSAIAILRASVIGNGVTDIDGTLLAIRRQVLTLEQSNPELSTSVRTNQAILKVAQTEFVAKLNSWFDQTVDRVDEAYTTRSYAVTMIAALAVAFALELDSLQVLNRLSVDNRYRATLVEAAVKSPELVQKIAGAPTASGTGSAPSADAQNALVGVLKTSDVVAIPDYGNLFTAVWWKAFPGTLLSAALLSLGGPFWYETLKNLLKLKSVLASKDDENRKERQSNQNPGIVAS